MRWKWWQRPPTLPAPPPDADEATRARIRAEKQLRETQQQTEAVRELAACLREHRRVNHFAELFTRTFEGGSR